MKFIIATLLVSLSTVPLASQDMGPSSIMRQASLQPTGFGLAAESVTAVHAVGFTPMFTGTEFGHISDTSLRYIALSNSRSIPYLAAPVDLEHGMLLTGIDFSACNDDPETA